MLVPPGRDAVGVEVNEVGVENGAADEMKDGTGDYNCTVWAVLAIKLERWQSCQGPCRNCWKW